MWHQCCHSKLVEYVEVLRQAQIIDCIQANSTPIFVIAWYSALVEEQATDFCFLEHHEIILPPR